MDGDREEWQQIKEEEDGEMKAQTNFQPYRRSQLAVPSTDPAHHNLD
jgi:hypothetical protein